MAPSTIKRPRSHIRAHHAPRTPKNKTPITPSKRVTLSVKVHDEDLENGLFRTPRTLSPSPSSTIATINTVATIVRKRRRAKPRTLNLSLDVADDLVPIDFAAWEEEHAKREREFAPRDLEDFRAVSVLGFPIRIAGNRDGEVPRRSDERVQTQTQESEEDSIPPPRCCAACGISGPAGPAIPQFPSTPPSHYDRASSTSRSPWSHLQLHPRRHVNQDTNSVTDLVVMRSGPVPQTVGFWYDLMIAEMARGTDDLDFKMLCLNLMRWRAENEVADTLVRNVLGRSALTTGEQGQRESRNGCDGVVKTTVWDDVLVDAALSGKIWRKRRRWMEREREKAAGWAVWEMRVRRHERGDFVDDGGVGAWVLREPGMDGAVRRVLRLGYRRSNEDAEFMTTGLAEVVMAGKCVVHDQDEYRIEDIRDDAAMDDIDPMDLDKDTKES